MRRLPSPIIAIFLFISGIANCEQTIVPKSSQVSDFEAALTLAKILSRRDAGQEAALKIYTFLLQKNPDNLELIIDTGRLLISLKQIQKGLDLFYSALDKHPADIKLLVAAAQAETASGHAKKAKDLFLAALSLADWKASILTDYADAMMSWGDYYKAEKIYSDALKYNSSLELFLKLTWSLESPQRYEEAESIYEQLLIEFPNEPKVLERLAKLKIREKKFDQAKEIVDVLLKNHLYEPSFLLLKAEIFFNQRLYCDAIEAFNELINNQKYRVHAYVGIGKAFLKMGQQDLAYNAFQKAYESDPNDIEAKFYFAGIYVTEQPFIEHILCHFSLQELYKFADIYLQNEMPEIALSLYKAILEKDPEFFPAQIGQAETFSILECYSNAITIYENLLEAFPANAKLMLAVARAYAWAQEYDTAIVLYDRIIQLYPLDPVPYREKARTALWNKQFNLAMATYNSLLDICENELDDYPIQKSIALEKRAKKLYWDKRYLYALSAYHDLLSFNPENEEAYFDKAQIYCSLGLCECSKAIYEEILHYDPNRSIVKQALYRNEMRNRFGLQGNMLYWREIGTGTFSASQIARYRLDQVFEMPLFCRAHLRFSQQEYVENPFLNFKFYPAEGQTIEADCLFNEYVSGYASATYKNYFHQFKSTVTGRNRWLFTLNDYVKVLLSCNKEDEIYNFFSLKQAIQATISAVTVSSTLTRYWNILGTYQYYNYNDHNSQVYVNLLTEYQLTEDPHVLKIILQGDYRNAAHQSISIFNGTRLVDMIHPYWTPDKYFSGTITLEVRHDYREIAFCEAPQRYVDIKITGGTDNTNNPSIAALLEWKHEFDCHWGFELKGLIHRSRQWNAEGFWGTLSYRF